MQSVVSVKQVCIDLNGLFMIGIRHTGLNYEFQLEMVMCGFVFQLNRWLQGSVNLLATATTTLVSYGCQFDVVEYVNLMINFSSVLESVVKYIRSCGAQCLCMSM